MKIRLFLVTVFFTALLSDAAADSYWEGAASMSRYGEFPVNGLYGASNSFPVNSIVEITNPSKNKKTEIIIVNKLNDNNLFILLSKDAAEKLSIKEDEIITVKAKIIKKFKTDESTEKDLSDDPDFNPSTALLMKDDKIPAEEKAEESYAGKGDLADEIIETIIISDIPEKVEETAVKPEETTEEEISPKEDTGLTAVIITEDDFPEEEPEEKAAEGLFEKYDPDTVIITEKDTEENTAEDEKAAEFEEKLVLVPSGPKPPENGYTDEKPSVSDLPAEDEKTEKGYNPTAEPEKMLDSNSYYLQIGAYRDFYSADTLAKKMNIDYPVFLYKKDENGIYRVMAGPLKKDEKGAALYQVRIKGVKDAFIRKGE